MPSSVVLEQTRPGAALANPLQADAAIALQWSFQDEHGRPIVGQVCTLKLANGNTLTANVAVDGRKCVFRLPKGLQVELPLQAQVSVNLAALGAHAAGALSSNQIETRSKSVNEPDADASETVYGELNQELRRTRTLYETFLVVVTGALATVFSQRSTIAGAYKQSIGIGLGFLALIVIYMIWQIAERYRKTSAGVFNLEQSWGLRAGTGGEYPLETNSSSWWRNHAWRHTIWAIGLTAYALLAIGIVIVILRTPTEQAKATSSQPITVNCSCCTSSNSVQTSGSVTPPAGKKSGGRPR